MVVTWVTMDNVKASRVEYGLKKGEILNKEVKGKTTLFQNGGYERRKMFIHRATMKDLIPGLEYGMQKWFRYYLLKPRYKYLELRFIQTF